MKYEAEVEGGGPFWAVVALSGEDVESKALAKRHARAMREVLMAARAWGSPRRTSAMAAEDRLLSATERLSEIEKEVRRGGK